MLHCTRNGSHGAVCSVFLPVLVTSSLFTSTCASLLLFDLDDLYILYRLATMKSFASLLAGSVALLSSLGSVQAVLNFTNGSSCGVAKADDSYFSVVGVQGTGVHPRQELRELQKDTELWNIFLQAFARFQAMDQTEKISYYQVAGKEPCRFERVSLTFSRDTRSAFPALGQGDR